MPAISVPTASASAKHPSKLWCKDRRALVTMSATDACVGQRTRVAERQTGGAGWSGVSRGLMYRTQDSCELPRFRSHVCSFSFPRPWRDRPDLRGACDARGGAYMLTGDTKHGRMASKHACAPPRHVRAAGDAVASGRGAARAGAQRGRRKNGAGGHGRGRGRTCGPARAPAARRARPLLGFPAPPRGVCAARPRRTGGRARACARERAHGRRRGRL